MNYTKKDFEKFKKECSKWLDRFWLGEWEVSFEHKRLNDSHANTTYSQDAKTALFSLDTGTNDVPVETLAKHEVIHLLLADISNLVSSRYIQEEQAHRTEHALVQKLMKLIQ